MSSITVQLTAMSLVAEETPTSWFETTRIDSGIYGDSDKAAPALPNEIAKDNGIWVSYGPHRLYEGWLLPPEQTWDDGERWYVPSGSYIDYGKRSGVFGRIFRDSDIKQWYQAEDTPSWIKTIISSEKFRLLVSAGNDVTDTTEHPVVIYWLAGGLRTDEHLDSVTFTLTKVGTLTSYLTLGVYTWSVPPIPGASPVPTSEATYTSSTSNGTYTVTIDHSSTAKQAVGFYMKMSSTATANSDYGFDISSISVKTSACADFVDDADPPVTDAVPELGQAMADIAKIVGIDAGRALHTYRDTSISTLVARPFTTVSGALDSISRLPADPLAWGYETGGWFDTRVVAAPDRTSKEDRQRWWSVSQHDVTFTTNVVTDSETLSDFVAVIYGALGVSGVVDGMKRICYRPTTPTDTDRVSVLDYGGRYMSTAEAEAVGDHFLAWQGAGMTAKGTITVAGDIRDVDGHVRPAVMVRPGDWIEERDRRGHAPWMVTGVSYDATGHVSISVGGAERDWSATPGRDTYKADDPLATWTGGGGSSSSEEEPEIPWDPSMWEDVEPASGPNYVGYPPGYTAPAASGASPMLGYGGPGSPGPAGYYLAYDMYGTPVWIPNGMTIAQAMAAQGGYS